MYRNPPIRCHLGCRVAAGVQVGVVAETPFRCCSRTVVVAAVAAAGGGDGANVVVVVVADADCPNWPGLQPARHLPLSKVIGDSGDELRR